MMKAVVSLIIVLCFLTVSVSAGPILLVTLDADSPTTGSLFVTPTSEGDITFEGTYIAASTDPDLVGVGSTGNTFDIYSEEVPWARLTFDFDVCSLANFVYGGNLGDIEIIAYDASNNVVDSFYQADTHEGYPAGPITLSGTGIRSLYWTDIKTTYTGYAALDNIEVYIPEPATMMLLGLGSLMLRKRRA